MGHSPSILHGQREKRKQLVVEKLKKMDQALKEAKEDNRRKRVAKPVEARNKIDHDNGEEDEDEDYDEEETDDADDYL